MKDNKYKAALFDLDGVVLDTETQYTDFWGSQCRLYHPELPGLEHKIKGQTLTEILDKYFDVVQRVSIVKKLDDFESQMQLNYIPGFLKFIIYLRNKGIKTAVVTSSNVVKMNVVYCQHPEFKMLFDRILTSEDFEKSKPDPDCYLKAAAVFGVSPEECIGFEDSFNGLKAVRASGAYTVGLATTNPAESIAPLADEVIDDFIGYEI